MIGFFAVISLLFVFAVWMGDGWLLGLAALAGVALAWTIAYAVSEIVAGMREAAAEDSARRAEDQAGRRKAREEILRKD